MKRLIIISLFLFVFAPAKAQLYFGIEAGGLLNQLTGFAKPQKTKIGGGPVIGAFTDGYISQNTSVFTELRYEHRSFEFWDTIPFIEAGKIHVIEKTHCIALPVQLKFKAGDGIFSSFFAIGGEIAIPFIHRQTLDITIDGLQIPPDDYANFKPSFYDYGLIATLGFQARSFVMKGGVYYGLRNFYQGKNIIEVRQMFANITMGFFFNYRAPSLYRRTSPFENIKNRLGRTF